MNDNDNNGLALVFDLSAHRVGVLDVDPEAITVDIPLTQEQRHLRTIQEVVSILRAHREGGTEPTETIGRVEEAIEGWAFPGDPFASDG